jgi:hypothetical protein
MTATFNETESPDLRVERTQGPDIRGAVVTSAKACEPCEGAWLGGTAKAGKRQRRDIASLTRSGRDRIERMHDARNPLAKFRMGICHLVSLLFGVDRDTPKKPVQTVHTSQSPVNNQYSLVA